MTSGLDSTHKEIGSHHSHHKKAEENKKKKNDFP